jgi:anti-sigma B factor antagonist
MDLYGAVSDPEQPIYQVDAFADPVAIKLSGRCNYLNCNAFREFLERMLDEGKSNFVCDFENCNGMDSTFLGILASIAMRLRRMDPPGTLVLTHMNERNLELVRNLGLHRLLIVDAGASRSGTHTLAPLEGRKVDSAEVILRAHESLVEAEQGNASKFQDCIEFLRNQVESEKE